MEGLSQSTVNTVLQDHQGYIWIVTEDGVNRYDGYQFRIFRYEEGNEHSLCNSKVYGMREDRDQNLWFVCPDGICVYRPSTDDFQRILYAPDTNKSDHSGCIEETADELLMSQNRSFYRLNKKTRKIVWERVETPEKTILCFAG